MAIILTQADVVRSVVDIDFEYWIKVRGVRWIWFDMDNTLLPHGTKVLPADVEALMWRIRGWGGSIAILSNNYLARDDTMPFSVTYIRPKSVWHWLGFFRKPYGFYYRMALRETGALPSEVVMIGDKLSRDVKGALKIGARGILVSPMGHDLPFDRWTLLREREGLELWLRFRIRRPTSPLVLPY